MVTEAKTQRGFQLTSQDVRSAASLILEELLEGRIDKDLKGHRNIQRIRTGPEKEKVYIHSGECENAVARSRTLPSNYREPSVVEVKQKNVEESPEKIQQAVNSQSVESSGSSADTEDSPSIISEKRKKKSFLKRARERLSFAFHRSRNKDKTVAKKANGNSNSKQRKGEKSTEKSINESQDSAGAHSRGRLPDGTEKDSVDKGVSMPADSSSGEKWNSKILSSFRRPRKLQDAVSDAKFQKNAGSRVHIYENSHNGVETPVPGKALPPSSLRLQTGPRCVLLQPQHTFTIQEDRPHYVKPPGYNQSANGSLASLQATPSSLPRESSPSHENSIFSGSHETSVPLDSAHHLDIRFHNRVLNTTQSILSSVLDSPGEDIEFIDAVDTGDRNESSKGSHPGREQNSTSLNRFRSDFLKSSRPTNLPTDGRQFKDAEVHPQIVLNQRPYSGAEASASLTRTNLDVPNEEEEEIYDEHDGVMDEPESSTSSAQDKEALYCVIAQKLIEMGDSLSASGSDQKSRSEDPESRKELSPLETDIINCLRSVGDRMTRQSKQDTYHRFQSTVQNTFQGEVSWNHLALLFYATKNVVSIVGKGSRAAVLAKDLTVQFVSDSCASWIIDQVGYDILVSSEESDFGVD